jgi:hypothetical protein
MTDVSVRSGIPSPFIAPTPRRTRTPSWLDFRLVAGVILVLVAVLAGSVLLASADHRKPFWQLTRDLAAGTVLQAGDLRPVQVQLGSAAATYVSSTTAVIGEAVTGNVSSGEFLARSELTQPPTGVTVTVPVAQNNAPAVAQGDRITVWVTTKTCSAAVVVAGVVVQDVKSASGSAFTTNAGIGIVLTLPGTDADRVITALDLDSAVIRVGVLSAGTTVANAEADLSQCGGTAK